MMTKTRMVIVISLKMCNNNIVVKCDELNKSGIQPTLDHCIQVNNLYMGCMVVTVVKCSVPGILIAVLFSDVPVAVTLYMAATVMFPLALAPMVKSAVLISRVLLS